MYCGHVFSTALAVHRHETKEHKHIDPKQCNSVSDNEDVQQRDHIQEYTRSVLTLGLLRLEHNDAISMADGQRIFEVDSFLMLVYRTTKLSTKQGETKRARAPKYAKALLEFMAQVQYLLPPSLAYELKWNKCVNPAGLPNSNYPNDLDVEHCNKYSKNEMNTYRGEITEKTALRVSRSASLREDIANRFDKQTRVHKPSGKHRKPDSFDGDIIKLVKQYHTKALFRCDPGHEHKAFKKFKSRVIQLDEIPFKEWVLKNRLKEFNRKHYYKQFE